jgi:mycothiol synthase
MAFVAMLGVRPAWRRLGLGQALLLHAFGAFHAGGKRKVFLGVDSENPTGATRLYERVGMHVRLEDIVYAKDLA